MAEKPLLTIDTFGSDALLFNYDCLEILAKFPDNYFDSIVTDPPYNLSSIVERFGSPDAAPANDGDVYARQSAGFMGQTWDNDIAMRPATWKAMLRVLKPGGHMVAFGGSRTSHRIFCAIEDAGFEIRDTLMWIYGSGFPKSHDLSKGIDKHLGVYDQRPVIQEFDATYGMNKTRVEAGYRPNEVVPGARTGPASFEAWQWEGWGSALKPAFEPIVLARKPLAEDTIAANVLEWRTGGINIDGCRVEAPEGITSGGNKTTSPLHMDRAAEINRVAERSGTHELGRWPANVLTDGSAEVIEAFPVTKGQLANAATGPGRTKTQNVYGKMRREGEPSADRRYTEQGGTNFAALPGQRRGDAGSAARFFYSAKASKADRAGSKHPTVKPVSLMQWLTRLITPPGGVVLDPFAGSGTTGAAALAEGFRAVLIEQSLEYAEDIRRRLREC